MTPQEFEARTGLTPIPAKFDDIHRTYMACGDMDKDLFCKEYLKKVDQSAVTETLTARVEALEGKLTSADMAADSMADFLIDMAEKYNAGELREKAIAILGREEYLRRKISRGYDLWKTDRKDLCEILKH